MTEAKPQNYWISPTALRITLNALSDADYIQASAASGAMIMCYMKGIDGLEYDHGHNYKRWPLKISPTYFTTATKKYVYVRIPRPAADPSEVDTDVAQVVFPSEHIDIYGYSEGGTLVGDEKFYYIYLQGIISASEATTEGLRRHWEQDIVTGTLASDEAYDAGGDGEWWRYNPVTDTVEFLKTISHAVFEFLEAAQATIHNLNVTGTLDAIKGYIDDLRSHNYQSGMLDGSGFRLTNDNGDGSSELEVDFLKVRKKATFMELEIREETFVGGNQHYSPAGSILYRVDYLDVNDGLLGYSVMKVPFLLKRFAFLGRVFNYAARKRVRRKMTDEEWKQCHHFRCYLLADDGTTATRNWWKVGDQPRCQTFNKAVSAQNKRDNGYNWKQDHFNDDPSSPMPKYTTIEGPFETSYYWRLVTNVGSEKLEDGHAYDFVDMPYEGWDVTIGGVRHHYTDDEKRSFRDAGSGIPVAGDTIVCMGNRTDQERMNMISLYTSGSENNPPAIKGYRGIHTFSINPENKVFEISPNEFLIRSRMFKLLDDSGYQFPVPLERGEWQQGVRYHWYDRVSWKGSIWLCQVLDDEQWEDASGNRYEEWRVEDIEYGEGEFDYYIDGAVAGTDHYYKKGKVGSTVVYYVKRYTYSEPDRNNDLWLREVAKGTEITDVETAYAASKSGTEHPADDSGAWKTVGKDYATPAEAIAATGIDDPEHKNGVYLWTRTKTFYDDANDPDRPPTVEYTVVRWGIDADGIYQINSYYLSRLSETPIDASSDSYPMPDDSDWKGAANNAKWFDAFSACAAANGGVGSMQGWMVWEKTVIIYDKHFDKDGKEDTKPDIITYKSSRIGQDGQIGMEEYYMLAESDDFKTVFGSLTPGYEKIGIRWYNQSNPAAENWRLSPTTPNINPSMWKAVMPAYDESQPKKKYLWNFEQRIDGQGTEYATKPICIGNHARGIKGVLELYALSASQTPISAERPIPSDIDSKNTWGVIPTTGFQDPQVWGDEKYDRAPTEALPYQWNWTRTLYSAADANGLTYEDHYHVSAVRGTKGEDGSGIEYIYKLTSSADAPATPMGQDKDDYVPEGWTDNPQGVSFQNQYEWVSERKSSATPSAGGYSGGHTWGPFSAPKLWSKWGKNGMDGDGVEYVFVRTTGNSAPSITNSGDTDPMGRTYIDDEYLPLSSAGRCTDDPVGVSHDYPYEWVSKRTKGSPNAETGVRQWQQYSGAMALWSTFAENNVRLDISNEMDMVQTDSTGKPVAARTVTTVARLFDGTTEIQITPRDLTVSGGDLTPTKTADGKGVLLTWTFSPTAYRPLTTAWEVNIGYAYKGETYKAVFTIAPSLGEVVWQLKPDMSAIPFQRGADNVLTPASRSVGLKLIMMDHDNTEEFSSVQQGIIVRYAFDAMPASSSAGTGWSSGDITVTNDKTNLFIALFNSSGVLLDRETVPVIKDGENGSNTVRIDLDNENDSMLYTGSGTLVSGNVTSTAYMFDGPTDVSTSATFSITGREGCTKEQATISGRVVTVTGMNATSAKVTVQGVYKDVRGETHTKTATLSLKKIVDGDKYDLVISPNAIPYNATTDTPATTTVSIKVYKTSVNSSGGATRALSAPPSGYGVYAGSTAITASSTGTYSTTTDNSEISSLTVKIAKSATSTDILDIETIPIAKVENGKSVTKKSESYRYATNNTGVRPAASSSDWKTTKPTLEKGYWLYVEITITWSDNSTTVLYTDERNPNDGVAGQDIIVDGATEMKYYVGDSNTTHPAETSSDWKDLSQVTQTQGKWLWSKATTYYRKASSAAGSRDAGHSVNYNVGYIAKDGEAADEGRGITGITEYYKATNSSAEMPVPTSDSGWSTDPNLSDLSTKWGKDAKYLWNFEKVTYSKAPTVERTKPQILAIWTQDGAAGRGIDSITNYYKVTDSATAPKRIHEGGSGWDDNPVAPSSSNPYLWNYEMISWVNGTPATTYTEVQLIGHFGKDGEDGAQGPQGPQGPQGDYELIRYARSTSFTSYADDYIDGGASGWKSTAPLPSVYYPAIWKRSIMYDPSTGRTYGSYSYVCLTGEKGAKGDKGNDGSPGKTGLWYRYLGVWGVDVTSVTNTNTVGYYVRGRSDKSFYMNVKDAGQPNTTTPGGSGWESMNSVFEYFMTKVTFADSAYLGSFIFNGDWMISQTPAPGSPSNSYEDFDTENPNTSTGRNFIPMYAVDGKTGTAYMHDLHATGELRVVNSSGDGVVRINAGDSAASATEKFVTILDASGLYSRGDTDGFKMVHDRFGSRMVRWNNMKSEWVPFYAGRSVRGVNNDANVDMDYDDFIICMTRELTLTFPSSGAREGKVITVKATGYEVTLKSSSQIFLRESSTPVTKLALHGWDRAELVYWGGFWYWSYMAP